MKFDEATHDSKPAPIGFVADVLSAARALVGQPTVALVPIVLWWLPILTVSQVSGLARINSWLAVVYLVYLAQMLFLCGWAGAERIFFLRQFEGKPITLRHLFGLVEAFAGRFIALGLLVGAAGVSLVVVLAILSGGGSPKAHPTQNRVVPAALAFTTKSVRRALRIGFSMIRQTWPRSALYVLCPVLVLNMNRLAYPVHLPMLRLIVDGALTVVGLLAKGATVAFYLRERRVHSDDGAAYIGAMDGPAVG
jgi:hypothetical protein